MKSRTKLVQTAALLALLAGTAPAIAQPNGQAATQANAALSSPIRDALALVPEDVRAYDLHITTLANPYMQGRVPGSEGMERAKDYVQYHFEKAGLEPAFPGGDGHAFTSFRDPFSLGGTWKVQSERLAAAGKGGAAGFKAENDFVLTGLGAAGEVAGEAVFVGYAIDNGPDGWTSFGDDTDLTGKIAVLFRFEPMTEEGMSQWNEGPGWSPRAAFNGKLRAVAERGAAGAVIINPPGSHDPRANDLNRFQSGGGGADFPVMMMTAEAADRLLDAGDSGMSIDDLRAAADSGVKPFSLGTEVMIEGAAGREELVGENVGGIIRGQGELADEWIVVGAHLDHLGMGYFGSRSGPGTLHPGADDNASGSAGLILLADKLAETLKDDPRPRRSILLVAFDGEESGLNGSRHYVQDPIADAGDHVLMVNWDMIGRIENDRLLVAGGNTGEGLAEFIEPFFETSGLEIVVPEQMSGASDHTSFYRAGIPVLFSIIADFHQDYHTPADEAWKINRVGAVKTVNMYHDIVAAAAVRSERFPFVSPNQQRQAQQQPQRPRIRVRLGIMPAYDTGETGITLEDVSEGGPAEAAGLRAGDRIVRWDGQKIEDIEGWMTLLARHSPGDQVNVGIVRDGVEQTVTVTLGEP